MTTPQAALAAALAEALGTIVADDGEDVDWVGSEYVEGLADAMLAALSPDWELRPRLTGEQPCRESEAYASGRRDEAADHEPPLTAERLAVALDAGDGAWIICGDEWVGTERCRKLLDKCAIAILAALEETPRSTVSLTVHLCPPEGSGLMPCCGRTPFEARSDRITRDPRRVTCSAAVTP